MARIRIRNRKGRITGDEIIAAFKVLEYSGIMTVEELADRIGMSTPLLKQRLWHHLKAGRLEIVLSLTREGMKYLATETSTVNQRSEKHEA